MFSELVQKSFTKRLSEAGRNHNCVMHGYFYIVDVQAAPRFCSGSIVAQDTDGLLHLSQISSRHNGGWLVLGADLKPYRTPVYELDRAPCLDFGYGTI